MLKTRIQSDMKDAMKARDKERLKVIRLILAAIKQVEVDERIELDDATVHKVLTKMVKQRRDSITQFTAGGRSDLAGIESDEIAVLETYLPEPMSDTELAALIDRAIADSGAATLRDMGKVMALIKSAAAGRADMGAVGGLVKSRLSP
jgi:uncharacterized protein YqeY